MTPPATVRALIAAVRSLADALEASIDAGERTRTPCESAILRVLGDKKLSTTRILNALEEADEIHGDSTVRMTLARMVKEGALVNDGTGYSIPLQST